MPRMAPREGQCWLNLRNRWKCGLYAGCEGGDAGGKKVRGSQGQGRECKAPNLNCFRNKRNVDCRNIF